VKKNIHMNRFKNSTSTQVTLDDDFIVPDTMDDMDQVILSSGDVVVESVKNQGERVLIRESWFSRYCTGKQKAGFRRWQAALCWKNQSMCRSWRKKMMSAFPGNWKI